MSLWQTGGNKIVRRLLRSYEKQIEALAMAQKREKERPSKTFRCRGKTVKIPDPLPKLPVPDFSDDAPIMPLFVSQLTKFKLMHDWGWKWHPRLKKWSR